MQTRSTLLQVFSDSFNRWSKRRRDVRELQSMVESGRGELSAVARDIGIPSDELWRVAERGPKAPSQLPELLEALALKEPKDPRILNDMLTVCEMCAHKHRCDSDLAAGTIAQHYVEYCGNSEVITSLSSSKTRT